MIRTFVLATLTLIIIDASIEASFAGTIVKMSCQKSLSDGRVLVANTRFLPGGSTFKVVGFQATESANGWATGPCLLDVTPKASR